MAQVELTDLDKEFLQKYVSAIPKHGVYVEIGTKYGGSAEFAVNSNPTIEVHGVDIDDTYLEYSHPRFVFHRVPSVEMSKGWSQPIDVLFIDADHDMAGIDFAAWKHHVKDGGIVIFHDYAIHSPKVIRDCDAILKDSEWELIRKPDDIDHPSSSMFICRKLRT